ncbi:hypothetical protein [Aeromicrobium panaciterrae]|uniref:hypothetical protein n=1 Tax=Aeromicrobium panaciterrae TaxID=363861 RepID=UPI0031D298DC
MDIDIEQLLRRVVDDVFGDAVDVVYSPFDKERFRQFQALVTSKADPSKQVRLRATYEWFDLRLLDLNVGTVDFDYSDDEDEKEAVLRPLATAGLAYLLGKYQLDQERTRLLRREKPIVKIIVDGHHWLLGRNSSRIFP